jgi:ribosomal protein L7/L12
MLDLEHARHIASLEARMSRMETMMQQLLSALTTSMSDMQRTMQLQAMLQELESNQNLYMGGTTGINPATSAPQERPEMAAIREVLRSGNKIKAIALYRETFGVGLKEAKDVIDKM